MTDSEEMEILGKLDQIIEQAEDIIRLCRYAARSHPGSGVAPLTVGEGVAPLTVGPYPDRWGSSAAGPYLFTGTGITTG